MLNNNSRNYYVLSQLDDVFGQSSSIYEEGKRIEHCGAGQYEDYIEPEEVAYLARDAFTDISNFQKMQEAFNGTVAGTQKIRVEVPYSPIKFERRPDSVPVTEFDGTGLETFIQKLISIQTTAQNELTYETFQIAEQSATLNCHQKDLLNKTSPYFYPQRFITYKSPKYTLFDEQNVEIKYERNNSLIDSDGSEIASPDEYQTLDLYKPISYKTESKLKIKAPAGTVIALYTTEKFIQKRGVNRGNAYNNVITNLFKVDASGALEINGKLADARQIRIYKSNALQDLIGEVSITQMDSNR